MKAVGEGLTGEELIEQKGTSWGRMLGRAWHSVLHKPRLKLNECCLDLGVKLPILV